MVEKVIQIRGLGKQYRLGQRGASYATLRDSLANVFKRTEKKTREHIWALNDVSLEAGQGDVIGVIGRNGAGKSTLLKILSRITEPTKGEAEIHGRVGSLLEVGTGFHPELTGRENIFLNGAILGMRKRELLRKFDEIVAFAETEKFIDTPVKFYSSGMYVRLAFAVAAHMETEILLIDEVLSVGDVNFQKKCLGKMSDVAKGGRTVLFVSHNMSAVNQLCNRCILLDSGRKVIDGAPQEVIPKYLSDEKRAAQVQFPQKKDLPAQIVKAGILNDQGVLSKQVHYQEGFKVSITIDIREQSDSYHTLLVMKDALNRNIVFTTDKDIADSALNNVSGPCEYQVCFPAKWFKPGSYLITLMFIKRKKGGIFGGDILSDSREFPLSFEIVDISSRRAKEKRYGDVIVAPELPWQFKKTDKKVN